MPKPRFVVLSVDHITYRLEHGHTVTAPELMDDLRRIIRKASVSDRAPMVVSR
jgi:hypothetical protein